MLALYSIVLFAQVRGLQLTTSVSPRTVYVGQQVSYDASMLANVLTQMSFQAPPEYTPPDVKGVTLYDFPFDTLKSMRDTLVSGLTFKAYTYHRAIFPLQPGVDTISPAKLVYTLPNPKEDDPYDPEVDSIMSGRQFFTVMPLPTAGRPPDFTGSVGKFTIAMHPDSAAKFHTGNSFVLHVSVKGTGNIDLLQRPPITLSWATIVPTTEQVAWDSASRPLVQGAKEFLWLVTPRRGGAQVIPGVHYSYFNPDTKKYEVAQAPPITVQVSGTMLGGLATVGDTVGSTPFPVMMRTMRRHPILTGVLVLLVLGGLAWFVIRAVHHDELDDIEDDEEEELEENEEDIA